MSYVHYLYSNIISYNLFIFRQSFGLFCRWNDTEIVLFQWLQSSVYVIILKVVTVLQCIIMFSFSEHTFSGLKSEVTVLLICYHLFVFSV